MTVFTTLKQEIRRKPGRILLFLLMLLLLTDMAIHVPMERSPDEKMRSDIPFWIAENDRLPTGFEPELLDNIWGFSYATMPYLPALPGALLIKAASALGGDFRQCLIACRFVNVFAALGCLLLSFQIGDMLFGGGSRTWLFVLISCFLPQFLVCGAYFNNDVPALFGIYLTLYALLRATRSGWSVRDCVLLSAALSVIVLCYYNAYGWLLVSVVYGFASCSRACPPEEKKGFVLKRFSLVFGLVVLFCGWFFVRNALLHDGDFLGRDTANRLAEARAAQGYSVHFGRPSADTGISFFDLMRSPQWWDYTVDSFFGRFGLMDLLVDRRLNRAFLLLVCFGVPWGIFALSRRRYAKAELSCLAVMLLIPVLLSLKYSYSYDYQPQGRYIFPLLPALAVLVSAGYGFLDFLGEKYLLRRRASPGGADAAPERLSVGLFSSAAAILLLALTLTVFVSTIEKELVFRPHELLSWTADGGELELGVEYHDPDIYDSVNVAVWTAPDQSDIQWLPLKKEPLGGSWEEYFWKISVDLPEEWVSDFCYLHFYGFRDDPRFEPKFLFDKILTQDSDGYVRLK